MSVNAIASLTTGILSLCACCTYAMRILKNQARPKEAALCIQLMIAALWIISIIHQGGHPWFYVAGSVGTLCILVLARMSGQARDWNRGDLYCASLAFVVMIGAFTCACNEITICAGIIMLAAATAPVISFLCTHQFREPVLPCILSSIGAWINLGVTLALSAWSFAALAIPIAICAQSSLILFFLLHPVVHKRSRVPKYS